MDFFFTPRGIALIGATPNRSKGGWAILKNLTTGYAGAVHPVNPRYPEIEGLPCYPDIASIPDPVDLAVIFVPAVHVPGLIEQCAGRGIRGVMIESGGFSEAGPDGVRLQKEIDALVAGTGIRVWGPNCMGLVDAKRRLVFSFVSPAIWEGEGLIPGEVSLIVQSGMLSGAFLIDLMTHGIMGISKVCSIGNKADVAECELLEYLIDDPDTGVIGLYLESFSDGRRFFEACRRSPKPVVVLKGGKSDRGAAAAMSHTASLAGNARVIGGMLAQAGAVEAEDFKEMMDICRGLALFPDRDKAPSRRKADRIAVLTYSGGAGIVSSDFMEPLGLRPADLSPETVARLKEVFPGWMPVSNPVDLWPAVERTGAEKTYNTAVAAVCRDPGVDGILIHAFAGGFALNPDLETMIGTARAAGKPIFCWLLGEREAARRFHREAQELGMPVYRESRRAVACLAALLGRSRPGMASPDETAGPSPDLPDDLRAALEIGDGPLDEYRSKRILAAWGIPVVRERLAEDPEAAERAAGEWDGPLVFTGLRPGEVHKTEKGLVRMGSAGPSAARAAYEALSRRMAGRGRVVIQPFVRGEFELMAGFFRDPQFGPCVLFGFGGILAEAVADARFALAPLSTEEALDLIGRLKAQRLLEGYRGAPPVDRAALARILVTLGRVGAAVPAIAEIDINPLIIREGRPVAVDATVIPAGGGTGAF